MTESLRARSGRIRWGLLVALASLPVAIGVGTVWAELKLRPFSRQSNTAPQVAELTKQLESPRAGMRQEAANRLAQLGEDARPALPKLQPKASTLSSHFAIPGLDRIPASELRGPVKVFRFGHGKVDF